ncbi:hypothetical protein PV10_04039 [Exophiala mesophila]|uniref:Uncharacterized protein n=1 Tax=Exophiala mesophila TaxID=212818 RepID=A0A0D2A120_EXOME|nr:uncharacterized protein PV10_04039 [Exophiala mesophila]KIV92773.1 hypothetical protein PV10_04039 [Exophiala mesophila]
MAPLPLRFHQALQLELKKLEREPPGTIQLPEIAVDFCGWAIEEPMPQHPREQLITVRIDPERDVYDRINHCTGNGQISFDCVFGRSLNLTPEEMSEGGSEAKSKTGSQCLIVGYASSVSATSSMTRVSNPQCRPKSAVGVAVPDNVANLATTINYMIVVTPILKSTEISSKSQSSSTSSSALVMSAKKPRLYAMLRKKNGSCVAHHIDESLVYFRHEFRDNSITQLDRRWAWVAKVSMTAAKISGRANLTHSRQLTEKRNERNPVNLDYSPNSIVPQGLSLDQSEELRRRIQRQVPLVRDVQTQTQVLPLLAPQVPVQNPHARLGALQAQPQNEPIQVRSDQDQAQAKLVQVQAQVEAVPHRLEIHPRHERVQSFDMQIRPLNTDVQGPAQPHPGLRAPLLPTIHGEHGMGVPPRPPIPGQVHIEPPRTNIAPRGLYQHPHDAQVQAQPRQQQNIYPQGHQQVPFYNQYPVPNQPMYQGQMPRQMPGQARFPQMAQADPAVQEHHQRALAPGDILVQQAGFVPYEQGSPYGQMIQAAYFDRLTGLAYPMPFAPQHPAPPYQDVMNLQQVGLPTHHEIGQQHPRPQIQDQIAGPDELLAQTHAHQQNRDPRDVQQQAPRRREPVWGEFDAPRPR